MVPYLLKINFLLLAIFSSAHFTSAGTVGNSPKKIETSINKTVETFMILRAIADDDPLFKYRKPDFKGRPILFRARKYFNSLKEHEAVKTTQELLANTSTTGDVIFQGLLYAEELPSVIIKYQLNSPYWKGKENELQNYLNLLKKFYTDANVEGFFEQNRDFYNGAIAEANTYLNEALIPTMEEYFGKKNESYRLVLIPSSPFGMGFGANVAEAGKNHLYQLLSPANDIEWDGESKQFESFGYGGEEAAEYYRDMVSHEFCHSFFTTFIESEEMVSKINETDSLFIPLLDSVMSKQGYPSWWGFVNEHLVRLGEIRLAVKMELTGVNEMRDYNIKDAGFILIPDAEKIMEKYEQNRGKYPDIDSFIPTLIDQLKNFSKAGIENKLKAVGIK